MTSEEVIGKGICYIVGAGENGGLDFTIQPGDFVIAADGGLRYLEESGRSADLVVGDFDSLGGKPAHPHVIVLKAEKDETDTFAAVREGFNRGYRLFHIYCGMGGQPEHTIANIQLLAYLSQNGSRGRLIGRNSVMAAVTDGSMGFSEAARGRISVFSFSERAVGVFLEGLKYELAHAVLTNTFPLGVSNEFTGKKSLITVTKGTILIVFPRDALAEIR